MSRNRRKKRAKRKPAPEGIQRPGRYVGGEMYRRDIPRDADLRVVLCYPDVYEIGMSHYGLMVLYHALTGMDGVAVERVFPPWPDLEERLRNAGRPLATLETRRPVRESDILFITIPHELAYTNILNILDLSGLAPVADRRGAGDPLVVCGGIGTLNPLPLSLFVDVFLVGDGEEAIAEIAGVVRRYGGRSGDRDAMLRALAGVPGCYVPAVHGIPGLTGTPPPVTVRVLPELTARFHPSPPLVPFCKPVHERVVVEVSRGCPRRCRFCQARVYYAPVRRRSPDDIIELVRRDLRLTGYDEVSLLSLNVADVPDIEPLAERLMEELTPQYVSLSLPSLRPEKLTAGIIRQISRVRKTGFTLAPEAGSERLRRIIGKPYAEDRLLAAAEQVFRHGWSLIKLYFMVGLPFERDEDIDAMIRLTRRILEIGRRYRGRRAELHVSAATFIPKPHTPFQWMGQAPEAAIRRRLDRIKRNMPPNAVKVSFHDPQSSRLEALLARGDHRMADALLEAFRRGCRFDAWREWFKPDAWWDACRAAGIDPAADAEASPDIHDPLPWDFIRTPDESDPAREFENARRLALQAGDTPAPAQAAATAPAAPSTLRRQPEQQPPQPSPGPPPSGQPDTTVTYAGLFAVTNDFRLFSHREITAGILRAARAAQWPLRYSRGFNPRPKAVFAQPAPLGLERYFEPFTFRLFRPVEPDELLDAINRNLPPDLRIRQILRLPDTDGGRLNKLVSATYGITAADPAVTELPIPGVQTLDISEIKRRFGHHVDDIPLSRFDKFIVIHHTMPGAPSVRRFLKPLSGDGFEDFETIPGARLCWNVDPAGETPWFGDE